MRALCFRAAKMQAVGCKRASLPTANRTDSDDRTAYSRAVFFVSPYVWKRKVVRHITSRRIMERESAKIIKYRVR